jgi:signal-transduction protein with cAMP-binding, CBS, and nucleotidyltransferase domain
MDITGMLKGHDLFRALTPKEVDQVSEFSSVKHYERGARIFKLNGAASHVFEVIEGGIHLVLPGESPAYSMVVSEVAEGELFGLSPLLGSTRYTSSAVAHTNTQVLAIEAEPLRDLLQRNSLVGFNTMNRVAQVYFTRYVAVIKNLQDVFNQIPLIR